jgi:hypothetical protein
MAETLFNHGGDSQSDGILDAQVDSSIDSAGITVSSNAVDDGDPNKT